MSPVSCRCKLPCIYTFCICVCLSKPSTGERHGMWNSKEPNQTSVNISPYLCIFHCSCVIFVAEYFYCICVFAQAVGRGKTREVEFKANKHEQSQLWYHHSNQSCNNDHWSGLISPAGLITYYAGKMMMGGGHCSQVPQLTWPEVVVGEPD